jgi:hypothetical protein
MVLDVKIRTRTTTTGVPFSKPLHIAVNVVKSPPINNITVGISLSNTTKYIRRYVGRQIDSFRIGNTY